MMKQKSFTLIELLVVIVIIGILAGVIMISTSSSINKANFAKAQAFSSTVQNELLSNLVSEWTFDEPQEGNITNDSWGNNHGTVIGATQIDDCVFGKCYSFDGLNSHIDSGNHSDLKIVDKITMSVWVKPFIQTANYKGIVDKESATNKGYGIRTTSYTSTTTTIQFKASNGIERGIGEKVTNNIWHYIVGIYNGNHLMMFVDGVSVKPFTSSADGIFTTETNLKIGGLAYSSTLNFSGCIDDIRIYNAALSSSQIKQNYIAGLNSMLANENISKEDYNERINTLAYEQE